MKHALRTAVLAFVCLGSLTLASMGLAASADDGLVKDFKKEFKKLKGTSNRVEAVLALEDEQVVGVVGVLVPVLKDEDPAVAQAAERVLGGLTSDECRGALAQALIAKKDEPTRVALLRVFEANGSELALEATTKALSDKSWMVRRQAAFTLSIVAREQAKTALLPLCDDKESAVRSAAYERLGLLRVEGVLTPAWRDLTHEVWQVRAAAIGALGKVRHRDSIPKLIDRLEAETGRLRQDIGRALDAITGKGLGERADAWRSFWNRYADRYQIPTDAELLKLIETRKKRQEFYQGAKDGATYHGVATPSKSMLFVLDVSGSMEQEVVDKARYKDGGYPSMQRLDIVKTELARTIEKLDPNVFFNIAAFATDVNPWKKKLVKANALTKAAAKSWLAKLEPIGGSSKEDLARVGLTGSANLGAGKTNTFAALLWSIGLSPTTKKPNKNYEVEIDTVFFLSDGRPSTGVYIETDDVLREFKKLNDVRGVVLHTFGIGDFEKDFIERLAKENGGSYVDLGK